MKTTKLKGVQLLLILSFSLCSTLLFAQEKSVQEQLMSKEWMLDATETRSYDIALDFAEKELLLFIIIRGERSSTSVPYYLSDSIETQFDNSKVGKRTNGKYIVYSYSGEKNDSFFIEEILELTDNLLKYKDIKGEKGEMLILRGVPKENK